MNVEEGESGFEIKIAVKRCNFLLLSVARARLPLSKIFRMDFILWLVRESGIMYGSRGTEWNKNALFSLFFRVTCGRAEDMRSARARIFMG